MHFAMTTAKMCDSFHLLTHQILLERLLDLYCIAKWSSNWCTKKDWKIFLINEEPSNYILCASKEFVNYEEFKFFFCWWKARSIRFAYFAISKHKHFKCVHNNNRRQTVLWLRHYSRRSRVMSNSYSHLICIIIIKQHHKMLTACAPRTSKPEWVHFFRLVASSAARFDMPNLSFHWRIMGNPRRQASSN